MSRFIRNTNYNGDTKNQMWMSMISDGHDIFCGCKTPFAHLLDSIFPEGHTDRNKKIDFVIKRDLQECLSGGIEEENHGLAGGTGTGGIGNLKTEQKEEGEDIRDEDLLQGLIDAGEDATTR